MNSEEDMSRVEFKQESLNIAAKLLEIEDVHQTLEEWTGQMSTPRPEGLGLGSKELLLPQRDTRDRHRVKLALKRRQLREKSESKKTLQTRQQSQIGGDRSDSKATTTFHQIKRWKKTDLLGPRLIRRKQRKK